MQHLSPSIKSPRAQNEIETLKSQLTSMQIQLDQLHSFTENTKSNLSTLRQENAILISDIQKENHYNRALKQQLEEERFFYQKEKEYFYKELSNKTSCKLTNSLSDECSNFSHENDCKHAVQYKSEILNLKNITEDLEHKLDQQSKASYDLCNKFLRMKITRDQLAEKYSKLQRDYLKVLEDMMLQLDETRKEVNFHADKRFEQPIHPTSAIFLQVLQRNSRLMHENSQLRLENQKLKFITQKYHKTKNNQPSLKAHVNKCYSSINLKSSESRNSQKYNILQRYKKHKIVKTNMTNAAATTAELSKFETICAPLGDKQYLLLPKNDSQHLILNIHENIPSRTMSAPEIIQSTNFLKKKTNVYVLRKECSTNT